MIIIELAKIILNHNFRNELLDKYFGIEFTKFKFAIEDFIILKFSTFIIDYAMSKTSITYSVNKIKDVIYEK